MTVLAYLGHHAAMRPGPVRRVDGAAAVLDDLGFTGDRTAPLAALSTGNLQKVGLAQAMG